MKTFDQVLAVHEKNLATYVPVVARVHGESHPVFYEVQKDYDEMVGLINNKEVSELKPVFENLRQITDNYRIPSDTCETYEAVYKMLSELDEAYSQ